MYDDPNAYNAEDPLHGCMRSELLIMVCIHNSSVYFSHAHHLQVAHRIYKGRAAAARNGLGKLGQAALDRVLNVP